MLYEIKLADLWRLQNKRFFDGYLGYSGIGVTEFENPDAQGFFDGSKSWLSRDIMGNPRELIDTLRHEMSHQYLTQKRLCSSHASIDWLRECNRIAKKMGYPHRTKRVMHMDELKSFPTVIRPPGFYGYREPIIAHEVIALANKNLLKRNVDPLTFEEKLFMWANEVNREHAQWLDYVNDLVRAGKLNIDETFLYNLPNYLA
jgi:hypothetical protein